MRFVAATHEVWVTEPGGQRIEVFAVTVNGGAAPPKATHAAFIAAPGGPESLAIDGKRGRAYTHKWKKETMAIDLEVIGRRRHLGRRLRAIRAASGSTSRARFCSSAAKTAPPPRSTSNTTASCSRR